MERNQYKDSRIFNMNFDFVVGLFHILCPFYLISTKKNAIF